MYIASINSGPGSLFVYALGWITKALCGEEHKLCLYSVFLNKTHNEVLQMCWMEFFFFHKFEACIVYRVLQEWTLKPGNKLAFLQRRRGFPYCSTS